MRLLSLRVGTTKAADGVVNGALCRAMRAGAFTMATARSMSGWGGWAAVGLVVWACLLGGASLAGEPVPNKHDNSSGLGLGER